MWNTFLVIAQIAWTLSSTFAFFLAIKSHLESAKLPSMADNTPEDTPVALQFPGQPWRDRSASPNSDDSDSEPRRPLPTRPDNEPSEPPTEIDPSAGPIPPFFVDPSRFITNPFPLPPPDPSGVNPFAGLPQPTQPATTRRDSRPRTVQGTSRPSRPPRGSPAAVASFTADSRRRTSRPSPPRRPFTKRTIKQEPSTSPQTGSFAQPTSDTVRPSIETSPTDAVSDPPPPSGPSGKGKGKGKRTKRASKKAQRKPRSEKNEKPAPRRRQEAVVTEPARNTRRQTEREGRRGRVEFGFGDLDRLERRRREERRAERRAEREKEREG